MKNSIQIIASILFFSQLLFASQPGFFELGGGLVIRVLSEEEDGSQHIEIFGANTPALVCGARALYEVQFNKIVSSVYLAENPGLTLVSDE